MHLLVTPVLLSFAGLLWQGVNAGAGASMTACVQVDSDPSRPYNVSFTAGTSGDHCMNNRGQNSIATVSKKGLTCASIGYVECKASSTGGDTCATDRSWWGTSYYIDATGHSGSTFSQWSNSGNIKLSNQSPGTYVCYSQALCTSTELSWSGTGSLVIIYHPGTSSVVIQNEDPRYYGEKVLDEM